MDHPPNTLLRPSSELPNHVYGLGYWRSSIYCSRGGFYLSLIWEEMVGWYCAMTCFILTSKYRTLRRGKHRLLLWPGVEADGSVETTTPSKMEVQDEMGRLEKVCQHSFSVTTPTHTPSSLSRSMNEETYRSPTGWTNSRSGRWRKYTLYVLK